MPTARTLLTRLLTALLLVAATACTWVKVPPDAQKVIVVPANRVSACTRLGTVSSTVKATILTIPRDGTKVRNELDDLARQQAVPMGANTLVRQSIADGKGSYIAYHCP
ncbi:MAG: DUF4156 domain-containing protein [Porticoccaceae bacterium]|nr:DUF4156 domain-containing protein [Porticoccaceae bacterium]